MTVPMFGRAAAKLAIFSALAAFATASVASAQEVRGIVRDATTNQPIAGAVLVLMDSTGGTIGRNITNDRGQYRITTTPAVLRIRFLRIGYRPREVNAPPYSPAVAQLDVVMTAVPTLLEPVRVTSGAMCPRRDDRLAALSLLEQARAGLLATVVARQTSSARMLRLRFERDLDSRDRPERQRVHVEPEANTTRSFIAALPTRDFVEHGFRAVEGAEYTYYGPDAETLLDDDFRDGYCFELRRDRARPQQIGLGFVPARTARGRIDIEGALWIDTTARELRDIQFRYLGMERGASGVAPSGTIEFRQLANGVTLIDRWRFKLPFAHVDTSWNRNNQPIVRVYYTAREVGGEIASAEWPDGFRWQASLGTLRLTPVDHQNRAVKNVVIRLEDTDYIGSPDSTGVVEFTNLLPGPYHVVFVDSALAQIGVQISSSMSFVAERNVVQQRRMVVTTAIEYTRQKCAEFNGAEFNGYVPDSTVAWAIGRVLDPRGKPVGKHINWSMTRELRTGEHRPIDRGASGTTSSDGYFYVCSGYDQSDFLIFEIWLDPKRRQRAVVKPAGRLTVAPLWLEPDPPPSH